MAALAQMGGSSADLQDQPRYRRARQQATAAPAMRPAVVDGKLGTWWEAAPRLDGTLTLTLAPQYRRDLAAGAVDRRGQRIERFALEACRGRERLGAGAKAAAYETTTVGQRLDPPEHALTTDRLRIREAARFCRRWRKSGSPPVARPDAPGDCRP